MPVPFPLSLSLFLFLSLFLAHTYTLCVCVLNVIADMGIGRWVGKVGFFQVGYFQHIAAD